MTPEQQTEIQRKARQDAAAQNAGWPVPWCPYVDLDRIEVYQKAFDAAARELKELRR